MFPEISKIISKIDESWVYVLDDDNLLHPDFYNEMISYNPTVIENDYKIVVVSQQVSGKDFTGLDIRIAKPENTKLQSIDMAQMLIHSSVFKEYSFGDSYAGEGEFVDIVYKEHPEWFTWIDKVLSLYNYIDKSERISAPNIMYIGSDEPELKSVQFVDYESDILNVKYLKNDENILEEISTFQPHTIVTNGENWSIHKNLSYAPLSIREKWIHLNTNDEKVIGFDAYNSSMNSILNSTKYDTNNMISFVTPVYNTGDKLNMVYESLQMQTYDNWEWVIVNDSSDGGKTLKIAEEIAKKDPRVIVYDFREKSNGNIGEVKYRGFSLSRGYLIAELDHDDILTTNCAEDLYNASMKHPECGFFYTDTLELNDDGTSHLYPDGFALGYGKYRTELYNGNEVQVCTQHNINPKTIRHIVGVPNHIRAWRRNTYFEIGGHNRELSIADDYELLVRTFLKTRMCGIPKLGYIQFIYNNATGRNTHDLTRDDIQRRVRTIAEFYNEDIKNRFEELGLVDWAYDGNKDYPLHVDSQFGEKEQVANIIYKI